MLALVRDILRPSYGFCALACLLLTGCPSATPPASAPTYETYRAVTEVAAPVVASDGQWSGWRGAQMHGVSSSPQLPTAWTEHQGARWRVSLPGRGNSSPIVWGDHVFVTSVVTTQNESQAALQCIDRVSGELKWQEAVGAPGGASHSKNGFASSTPATDGERVYAAFGGMGLFAFDFSGKLLWHAPFPSQDHEWGTASSPVVFQSSVIHVVDGKHDSAIVSLDKLTGHEVWRTPRQSHGSWSSPVLLQADTGAAPQWQVIVNGTGSASGSSGDLIAYDPITGQETWKVHGTSDIPCPTAIVGNGLVVSSSGSNGPIFAVRPDGQGDVTNTHRAWHLSSGGPYVPSGVIYDSRLFLVSDAGLATCLRVSDGSVLWRKRLQGAFSASLVAGGGHVYAVSERGDVYVFKAGDKFELIATNRLHQPCVATPALAHGEIYLRTQEALYCISATSIAATEPADIAPAVDPATIRSPADVDAAAAVLSQ